MLSHFHWYERYLGKIIPTYSVVTICDGHYATLSCFRLLLYCNNSNKKMFVHHSILIDLADLVCERSRQISYKLASVHARSFYPGGRAPTLEL